LPSFFFILLTAESAKKGLIIRKETAKWRGEYPSTPNILLKAQAASWLSARLFSLDRFLQNSLSNYREFYRKLSREAPVCQQLYRNNGKISGNFLRMDAAAIGCPT
jgi:hypothetical protein